jgi:two-component system, chemotaxis family, chemotaxis protein CheY
VNQPLSKLRVMLVEDDPTIAQLLQAMVQTMGVEVVFAAKDGLEALRFLGEHDGAVNAVVCDWNMPHMSGIELLRQVRSVDANMQFLMVTGNATADHVLEARRCHVSAFITKPFYAETIREKLEFVANNLVQQASPTQA